MTPHATDIEVTSLEASLGAVAVQAVTSPKKSKPVTRTIKPYLELESHPIDQGQHLKVVVVGAGLAGITAGILLPQKVPGIQLKILERHSDISGTWHVNRYPGVRCDIPADVYQSSFSPNTSWSENYAQGAEIKAYWKSLAEKHDVNQYIQLNTTVERAEWSEAKGLWIITTLVNNEPQTEEAHFLITATGHFSSPQLPDYPGKETYRGHLRHSSDWGDYDGTDKRIAVIGNGASGLQVVPQLQKIASHVDHYARNRTWIAGSFGGETLSRDPGARELPPQDPEGYLKYRKGIEKNFFKTFGVLVKDGDRQKEAREKNTKLMAQRLGDRTDLLDEILPDFPINCRRLTPGPGYLEALQEANVGYVTTHIERFTESGLRLVDGRELAYDAIICSTGHNVGYTPTFTIIANGRNLQDDWSPSGQPGFPDTYLGVAIPNYPNLFSILGPNGAGLGGSIPNVVENIVTYIAKILRKASREGIKSLAPTREATDDFRAYCESFFPTTVLSEKCSSWYNGGVVGGRIVGIWPGSGSHANFARRDVRWEDFRYTYRTQSGNRFAWLGNGHHSRDVEIEDSVDVTPYLKIESVGGKVDLRAVHEDWFEV